MTSWPYRYDQIKTNGYSQMNPVTHSINTHIKRPDSNSGIRNVVSSNAKIQQMVNNQRVNERNDRNDRNDRSQLRSSKQIRPKVQVEVEQANFDWLTHYFCSCYTGDSTEKINQIIEYNRYKFRKAIVFTGKQNTKLQQLLQKSNPKIDFIVINQTHSLSQRQRKAIQFVIPEYKILITNLPQFKNGIIDIQQVNLIINEKLIEDPYYYRQRLLRSKKFDSGFKGVVISLVEYEQNRKSYQMYQKIQKQLGLRFQQYIPKRTYLNDKFVNIMLSPIKTQPQQQAQTPPQIMTETEYSGINNGSASQIKVKVLGGIKKQPQINKFTTAEYQDRKTVPKMADETQYNDEDRKTRKKHEELSPYQNKKEQQSSYLAHSREYVDQSTKYQYKTNDKLLSQKQPLSTTTGCTSYQYNNDTYANKNNTSVPSSNNYYNNSSNAYGKKTESSPIQLYKQEKQQTNSVQKPSEKPGTLNNYIYNGTSVNNNSSVYTDQYNKNVSNSILSKKQDKYGNIVNNNNNTNIEVSKTSMASSNNTGFINLTQQLTDKSRQNIVQVQDRELIKVTQQLSKLNTQMQGIKNKLPLNMDIMHNDIKSIPRSTVQLIQKQVCKPSQDRIVKAVYDNQKNVNNTLESVEGKVIQNIVDSTNYVVKQFEDKVEVIRKQVGKISGLAQVRESKEAVQARQQLIQNYQNILSKITSIQTQLRAQSSQSYQSSQNSSLSFQLQPVLKKHQTQLLTQIQKLQTKTSLQKQKDQQHITLLKKIQIQNTESITESKKITQYNNKLEKELQQMKRILEKIQKNISSNNNNSINSSSNVVRENSVGSGRMDVDKQRERQAMEKQRKQRDKQYMIIINKMGIKLQQIQTSLKKRDEQIAAKQYELSESRRKSNESLQIRKKLQQLSEFQEYQKKEFNAMRQMMVEMARNQEIAIKNNNSASLQQSHKSINTPDRVKQQVRDNKQSMYFRDEERQRKEMDNKQRQIKERDIEIKRLHALLENKDTQTKTLYKRLEQKDKQQQQQQQSSRIRVISGGSYADNGSNILSAINQVYKQYLPQLNISLNSVNYKQQLKKVLKSQQQSKFLSESQLYAELPQSKKQFLYKSILSMKGFAGRKITKTRKLFQQCQGSHYDHFLLSIEGKKNLLALVELENKNIVAAFCQDAYQQKKRGQVYNGDAFLMSITNSKIYKLRQRFLGHGISYDEYMVKFGNNEFLLMGHKMQFNVIFGKQFGHYQINSYDKIQTFIGQSQDVGKYTRLEFHQIFVE